MTETTKNTKKGFWERNRASGGYLLKKTLMGKVYSIVRMVLLFGMCFLILQPIFNKISLSLMEERDLYDTTVVAVPAHLTVENYQLAASFMSYGKTLVNTAFVSLSVALLQIAVCTLVGYGFARFEFPLKKFWFACVILVIVIPPQTLSTSLYLHFRYFDVAGLFKLIRGEGLNLRNSPIPYYLMSMGCMGLKNGLYIYMIRQFFRNIPKELEEAAYVDGAGTLKTFFSIMLPDATPILTSCFLFSYVWQWTDGFYSKTFMGDVNLLATQLTKISDRLGNYMVNVMHQPAGPSVGYTDCIIATGTLMVVFPLLILYLFAQRGFVESISSSGIKM